jgi:dihydrolipoamide dehydrogenase
MDIYDLAIIGGGPAGYRAAELAAKGGLMTLLFETKALGGVCLNEGCIPTKALLNSAKVYAAARDGERLGVKVQGISLDHASAMANKARAVRTLVAGVDAAMRKAGVTLIKAHATIQGRNADGFLLDAGNEAYTAKRLLIATGSVPVLPPIPGLKEALASGFAGTSSEMLEMAEVPQKLAVIGGGVIGLELASYWREAGSQVEVIEMLPAIGGPIDGRIASILLKSLEKSGIKFNLSCKVTRIGDGRVTFEKDGAEQSAEAGKVLVSVGRKPFTEGVGLETIGVVMERGAVVTDEKGQTNVEGVFAAGDVNGRSMLAHTAYREAELCVNAMLGREDRMNYDAIPSVIYTHPEAASVGLTTAEAQRRGIEADEVELPMRFSGRYVAENPTGNDVCILVVEKSTRRVVGVHMCGSYASEIIYGSAMMIEQGMTAQDVRRVVFPHPTVSEVLREAAFEIE